MYILVKLTGLCESLKVQTLIGYLSGSNRAQLENNLLKSDLRISLQCDKNCISTMDSEIKVNWTENTISVVCVCYLIQNQDGHYKNR